MQDECSSQRKPLRKAIGRVPVRILTRVWVQLTLTGRRTARMGLAVLPGRRIVGHELSRRH